MPFIRPIIKGGGTLGTKSITENGTYEAVDDKLNGYSEVTVNVSGGEDVGYVRVTGVPDGDSIIANAPIIESGGINYYPIYYICAMDTFLTYSPTKTGTGVSTGADAYVFSDEPTTLYVGDTTHTFDPTEDFETSENWKCRYVIMYATEANKNNANGITVNLYSYKATFEIIGSEYLLLSSTSAINGNINDLCNNNLRYVNIENSNIYQNKIYSEDFLHWSKGLIECILPLTLTMIDGSRFLGACRSLKNISLPFVTTITQRATSCMSALSSLKSISLPSLVTVKGSMLSAAPLRSLSLPLLSELSSANYQSTISDCYALENVYMPSLHILAGGGTSSDPFTNCVNLKYIDLSNLTTFTFTTAKMLNHTQFIKLKTDFDIGDVNFTGATGYTKSQSWFNHLATQLKDNSGGSAKTMILGSANIALIPSEIATIISDKNWTLS